MLTLSKMLENMDIRYCLDEGLPEELVRLDLHGVFVLPDKGTIFDPSRLLDYNIIKELELLNYKVYQLSDLRQIRSLLE